MLYCSLVKAVCTVVVEAVGEAFGIQPLEGFLHDVAVPDAVEGDHAAK